MTGYHDAFFSEASCNVNADKWQYLCTDFCYRMSAFLF
jgi:hypothetical protein